MRQTVFTLYSVYSVLIDASHKEDFRVVLLDKDNSIVKFSFELGSKKHLKGNLYMASIVRVDLSLQAVFVDYGMDKLGFLPFSEIHPQYYQIPQNEKSSILNNNPNALSDNDQPIDESLGSHIFDAYKKYKLQNVIKEGQTLLVQIVKEERGTKGAYMTSFLGLSGKFSVLLPNTPGKKYLSKSITNSKNREKLQNILNKISLENSDASIILRSASEQASQTQIINDLNYLAFLWSNIRKTVPNISQPTMLYDSGNILKRTLRDLPLDEIKEIIIDDPTVMESASSFLKTISDNKKDALSHIKMRLYKGVTPIFTYYKIENYLSSLSSNTVQLRNAGYLIISVTEALISVDVNSGSTLSHKDIEKTALSINKDAAFEIARQIQLRSLSGLIAIDFIDMHLSKNRKTIENTLKKAFSDDSAKLQFSEISQFGILEMSRQRIAHSYTETYCAPCPNCKGTGLVKSTAALSAEMFHSLLHHIRKSSKSDIKILTPQNVILHTLNNNKRTLADIETEFGIKILLYPNESPTDTSITISPVSSSSARIFPKKTTTSPTNPVNDSSSSQKTLNNPSELSWLQKFFNIIL